MDWLIALVGSPGFWAGLGLIALALPGPQTRWLPRLLRAVARSLRAGRSGAGGR